MVGPVRRSTRRVPRHDPIGPRPQGSANNAASQGAAIVPHNASEAGLNSQIARTMIEYQVENGSMDAETQRYYLYELHKLDQTRPDDDSEYTELLLRMSKGNVKHLEKLRKLGSGGFGSVRLWRWTPMGVPDEQWSRLFAAKDTTVHWGRQQGGYGRYCSEGELVRRLNARDCPNIVKVYDWALAREAEPVSNREAVHRILLEYYPNGDLYHLARFYGRRGLLFPEGFLWHVFGGIATAILYCAHGGNSRTKTEPWEEIIHKDLKEPNGK